MKWSDAHPGSSGDGDVGVGLSVASVRDGFRRIKELKTETTHLQYVNAAQGLTRSTQVLGGPSGFLAGGYLLTHRSQFDAYSNPQPGDRPYRGPLEIAIVLPSRLARIRQSRRRDSLRDLQWLLDNSARPSGEEEAVWVITTLASDCARGYANIHCTVLFEHDRYAQQLALRRLLGYRVHDHRQCITFPTRAVLEWILPEARWAA